MTAIAAILIAIGLAGLVVVALVTLARRGRRPSRAAEIKRRHMAAAKPTRPAMPPRRKPTP